MSAFLHKLLKFFTIFIISMIVLFVIILKTIDLNKSIFKLKNDDKILVLGDSQTECALNDTIICNSANLSLSSDTYFYSYIKLVKYVENNSQINTVVLNISYHSLQKSTEEWFSGDESVKVKLPRYFFLMNYSQLSELYKSNPSAVVQSVIDTYKKLFKLMLKSLIFEDYKEYKFGQYIALKRDKIETAIDRFHDISEPRSLSEIQIKYLLNIYKLCIDRGIKLILITTPLYELYRNRMVNEKAAMYNFISAEMEGVFYLDYSTFDLPKDFYGDLTHLNYNGSRLFSSEVNDTLRSYIH